jgi:hypothetical protein
MPPLGTIFGISEERKADRDDDQSRQYASPYEYISEFYRPVRGDLVLNPVDERCPYWAPWLELSERYYEADAATLAASLIAEPPRGYESGSDHFFRQSSRTLLESMLGVATPKEPRSIPKLQWEESPALVGLTDAAQA